LTSPTPPLAAARANSGLHIPSLDGIRALAALIVFVSHAGLQDAIPGGFGVTIFFFLSGYLITTLLRQEYEQRGAISLSSFYLRRICRIIPPLYIVLLLLLLPFTRAEAYFQPTLAAVAAQFAQLTNYYVLLRGSAHLVPDTVATWSLAIEEHFYLLFPLLLVALLKLHSYRRIALVFASLCAAVLAWRCWLIYGLHVSYDYTYYATDARIDSLLYGCIMGIGCNPALDRQRLQLSNGVCIAALALAAVLLALTFLDRSESFRATFRYSVQGLALLPIFFIAVRKSSWRIFSWLESRPMRFLGLISYSFYLVHVRALHLAAHYLHAPMLVQGVAGFALTVAFASAMYYLVERHLAVIRRRLHALLPAAAAATPRAAADARRATQPDS
jgi:peptidoglycan/LPS O-acetylase OafA/YrhL